MPNAIDKVLADIKAGATPANILEWAPHSECFTWFRIVESSIVDSIDLVFDDKEQGRRLCVSVRLGSGLCEYRSLCGFDEKRNRWADYCAPAGSFELASRRGLKALKEWASKESEKATGWPGFNALFLYPKSGQYFRP